jgi:hypothetical protein
VPLLEPLNGARKIVGIEHCDQPRQGFFGGRAIGLNVFGDDAARLKNRYRF